jgi:hypothetical protein
MHMVSSDPKIRTSNQLRIYRWIAAIIVIGLMLYMFYQVFITADSVFLGMGLALAFVLVLFLALMLGIIYGILYLILYLINRKK